MIPWLEIDSPFPPLESALTQPNGLLCAGADLSPERLLLAYAQGIFPWFNPGEPILWWSPDPRMILVPSEMKISRSLAKTLKSQRFEIRCDSQFAAVMEACAAPRHPGGATWISAAMRQAYQTLHELGFAHSVESWRNGKLVGGLYGLALGRVFFGESMFSRDNDASKVALAHLTRYLDQAGFTMIDCQMTTAHLASLGGRQISRREFAAALGEDVRQGGAPGLWPSQRLTNLFRPGGTP